MQRGALSAWKVWDRPGVERERAGAFTCVADGHGDPTARTESAGGSRWCGDIRFDSGATLFSHAPVAQLEERLRRYECCMVYMVYATVRTLSESGADRVAGSSPAGSTLQRSEVGR